MKFAPWVLAARPKTLPESSSPVVIAAALAWIEGSFALVPFLLALIFAVFAQIAANLANDWADFKKGVDKEGRLGPDRMVALGILSPKAMLIGACVSLAIACGFGLGLVAYGGLKLIALGAVCALAVFLYSAGPYPLAYIGLGDVAVVLFFGLAAVCGPYYVQTGHLSWASFWAGLSFGFASDAVLTANNYRDRVQDRENRKFTLIALFGERFGRYFFLSIGLLSALFFALCCRCLAGGDFQTWLWLLPFPGFWLVIHLLTWRKMIAIFEGKQLNKILEQAAKNTLLLALFYVLAAVVLKVTS